MILLVGIIVVAGSISWWNNQPSDYLNIDEIGLTPSWQHWLGTDAVGRDYLTLVANATLTSLGWACYSGAIAVLIALGVALMSASSGYSMLKHWLLRSSEAINAMPLMPILLACMGLLSLKTAASIKLLLASSLIGLLSWPSMAIVLNGLFTKLNNDKTVLFAHDVGYPWWLISYRYYYPPFKPLLLVYSGRLMSRALLAESGLSFLGFGVLEPNVSLGLLISYARRYQIMVYYPYQWLASGAVLVLCSLAFYLMAKSAKSGV